MSKNQNNIRIFDTNIYLRFITNDDLKYGPEARELFIRAQKGEFKIYLDELVLGEIIWTLQSFYKYPRDEINKNISKLLDSRFITNPRIKIMKRALEKYVTTNLSYSDCWICEVSKAEHLILETFDKDLAKQVIK